MSTGLGRVIFLAVVTAVVGLLVMECYQTTPWLADRVMRWSARLRYVDNSERAQVRGEELIALLGDLPTLFKLPTASAFLLRALTYRLANCRSRARREPRAVQRSLGVRFRIALFRAVLVFVCVGAVFGVETFLSDTMNGPLFCSLFGAAAGILAAIESVIRPPHFLHGLSGGIALMLTSTILDTTLTSKFEILMLILFLFCGVSFAVATMLTCVLVGKFKDIGVIIGILVNIVGVASVRFVLRFVGYEMMWMRNVVVYSGLGLAAGVLAGFATVRIRMIDSAPTSAALADSLSGAGALNLEPSIPIGEPRDKSELRRSLVFQGPPRHDEDGAGQRPN